MNGPSANNSIKTELGESTDNNIVILTSEKLPASNSQENNNIKMYLIINKQMKTALQKALLENGIDIILPEKFIQSIYKYFPEQQKSKIKNWNRKICQKIYLFAAKFWL